MFIHAPKIICKPEQSGKTFKMFEIMMVFYNYGNQEKKIINILFSANNLLLNKQTLNRTEKIFTEKSVEFSSKCKCKKYESLWFAVTRDCKSNIICCTNNTRINDILQLLEDLNKQYPYKYQFNIWIDEFHTFYKNTISFCNLNINDINIYGLTATPKADMFKIFNNKLEFFPLDNVTSSDYHGWNDNIIECYDFKGKNIDFAEFILKNNVDLIKEGTIWFVPADYKIVNHEETKNLLNKFGFVVIVVNSNGICITFQNKRIIKYEKNKSFDELVKEIYIDNNLYNYPVALTGQNCIGEAITIQSKEFLLDFAIFSSTGNEEKDSQLAGRTKGNFKNSESYKNKNPCKVFVTDEFNEIAKRKENLVHELNKQALKNEDYTVTTQDYKIYNKKYKLKPEQSRIPIIIKITEEDELFRCKDKKERIYQIVKENKNEDTYNFIKKNICNQITMPDTENSYKKHIIDAEIAYKRNEKFTIDIKDKTKTQWSCYIDKKEFRIIIIYWVI